MGNGQWERSVNVKSDMNRMKLHPSRIQWSALSASTLLIWLDKQECSSVHCLYPHCWTGGTLNQRNTTMSLDGIPKPSLDSHQKIAAGWGNSSHKQKKWPNVLMERIFPKWGCFWTMVYTQKGTPYWQCRRAMGPSLRSQGLWILRYGQETWKIELLELPVARF